jgi:hypothetical protein
MPPTSILQQPVSQLELSEAFKQMAIQHDFRTLKDILNWPASVLLLHQNFSYHIYQELRKFLKERELLDLLKRE